VGTLEVGPWDCAHNTLIHGLLSYYLEVRVVLSKAIGQDIRHDASALLR